MHRAEHEICENEETMRDEIAFRYDTPSTSNESVVSCILRRMKWVDLFAI